MTGLLYHFLLGHYLIGIDSQRELCLGPGSSRIFLIEKGAPVWRGDLVAFLADERMEPFFRKGQILVKRVAGVPGDRVTVDSEGVAINGLRVAKGLAVAEKLKRPKESFYLSTTLLPDHYFAVGTYPRSFDSRYYGPVRAGQIVGRAWEVPYLTGAIQWIFDRISEVKAEEIDLEAVTAIRDRTRAVQTEAERLADVPKNIHAQEAFQKAQELATTFQKPNRQIFNSAVEAVAKDFSRDEARRLAGDSFQALFEQAEEPQKRRFLILVSSSLGEGRLKELFSAYAGKEDVVFVFQGLLEGQKIEDFAASVHDWIKGIDPPPNVTLDPLVFKEHGVTHVPVMLALEGEKLLARIDGLVNVEWLKEKLASKNFGDRPYFAQHGQVIAASERNLMDVIEERLAAIDWEEKRQKALERFWSHQTFVDLPPAQKDRKRLIDMRVKVPQDVLTPDGKLIAKAGEVFSPLEKIPFRQALVIFDATVPPQVDWARSMLHEAARDGLVPVLITTRLPEGREWDTLEAIERDTGFPVYLLPGIMKERFEIEYTPTLITPHDSVFVQIAEFRLCQDCSS